MPIAPVNGIEIEYQELGPFTDGSEAVIFLHGAGGNLLSWFKTKLWLIGLDGKFGGIILVLLFLKAFLTSITALS